MTIESPNNWFVKAGARFENNQLILPFKCLLAPMALASEAILAFREADNLNDRIKHGLTTVTMVRIADTAYYRMVAKIVKGESEISVCEHCLRGQLWLNQMKNYRKDANQRIIHKMEEGLPVNEDDLETVELYYEEMFTHPLTNPFSCSQRNGLNSCPGCIKKNKQLHK